ncbi:glutathione S-transferase [Hwanghaeella grinnelliae]|uniref:Glutathione S-transferase n=1 Tax=Hwanghaeella grinnelliae TaxID=2500179 RepID=A0A437QJI2_9PROT|nr:glutathione S-transferase [Hwanghaeella grinnelliae]RVU34669.1 glutathione S-transferase [Hwanghaeella grinnelliae]
MLTIWGRANSFNVQKVMWLIGELELPHLHVEAGGKHGGLDEPEFLAMNPHGKIPLIKDGEVAVWESHAILRYLAASYERPLFWPAAPADRARIDAWMDWAHTALQPDFLNGVFWGYFRTPAPKRDMPKVEAALAQCTQHFSLLDGMYDDGRHFLLGDHMSLADIAIGTHLYRYFEMEIDRPELPHLAEYYQRLQNRPAYRHGVMIPFDDLYGRLDF